MSRTRTTLGAALLAASLFGGCAALKATSDPQIAKAIDQLPLPKELADKLHYYQKYAAKFRKFHDSGELGDEDVRDVLEDVGVIPKRPPRPGRKPRDRRPPRGPSQPPVQTYGGTYVWPTAAGVVSSEFGARWGKSHKGLDIAADTGEPVRATASGVVIYAGSGLKGYGNVIILRHDARSTSLYAHNSRLVAKLDQKVRGGQLIAKLGSTGRSTGPHLHFEIREGDTPIDPRTRLGESRYHAASRVESLELSMVVDGVKLERAPAGSSGYSER